jgi:hypothetical protein
MGSPSLFPELSRRGGLFSKTGGGQLKIKCGMRKEIPEGNRKDWMGTKNGVYPAIFVHGIYPAEI